MCDHPIAESDFVSLTSTTLTLTGTDGENCSTISILDDSMVERNETFSVQLSTSNTAVDITQNSAMVTIVDDDAVTVGWSTLSYGVDENDALVTVCAEIIQGEIARPVIIFYSTMDGSALSNNPHSFRNLMSIIYYYTFFAGSDDYTSVSSMELTFQPATATEPRCGDIQIVNEDVLEEDESFNVILGSSDNAVVVDSNTATVTIRNDDSKFHQIFSG